MDDNLSQNQYTHVLNNPLKYTDPSGNVGLGILGGISSALSASKVSIMSFFETSNNNSDSIVNITNKLKNFITSTLSFMLKKNDNTYNSVNRKKLEEMCITDLNINACEKISELNTEIDKKAVTDDKALSSQEKNKNAELIYKYLTDKGWSKKAICAVIGNMDVESYLSPGKTQDYGGNGYGLVQWDPGTKYLDWASYNNYERDSLTGQLEYLLYSMGTGKGNWLVPGGSYSDYSEYYLKMEVFIKSNESIEFLTQVFLWSYERPNPQKSHTDDRINSAKKWYNYF